MARSCPETQQMCGRAIVYTYSIGRLDERLSFFLFLLLFVSFSFFHLSCVNIPNFYIDYMDRLHQFDVSLPCDVQKSILEVSIDTMRFPHHRRPSACSWNPPTKCWAPLSPPTPLIRTEVVTTFLRNFIISWLTSPIEYWLVMCKKCSW